MTTTSTTRRWAAPLLALSTVLAASGCVSEQQAEVPTTVDQTRAGPACSAAVRLTRALEVEDGRTPDLDEAAERLQALGRELPEPLQDQVVVLLRAPADAGGDEAVGAAWAQLRSWSAVMCEHQLLPEAWLAAEPVQPTVVAPATRPAPVSFDALVAEVLDRRDVALTWHSDQVAGTVTEGPEGVVVTVTGVASPVLGLAACTDLATALEGVGPLAVVVRDGAGELVAVVGPDGCRPAAGTAW